MVFDNRNGAGAIPAAPLSGYLQHVGPNAPKNVLHMLSNLLKSFAFSY